MSRRERNPRCYFSLRSPYSWLAFRDLTHEHPEVAKRIEWIPFWEPDAGHAQQLADEGIVLPYVAMSAAKHRYILQDVRRLTRARGLEQVWPMDRAPWWEPSHLGWFVADAAGYGLDYLDVVYRMRWQEGADISDPATMAEAARRLGLDGGDVDRLAGAGDDPELRAASLDVLRRIHRDSVFGVPMFVDGFDRYWGMERLGLFCAAVTAADTTPADTTPADAAAAITTAADTTGERAGRRPVLAGVAGDAGHAGGCG